MAIIAKYLQPV